MMNTIYLDHHATTPLDARVLAAMGPYFGPTFGNPHSKDHNYGWCAAQAVEKALLQVAGFIGADPDEIVFTSGATEANNLALLGVARRATEGNRRRVLVSAIEHRSVLEVARVIAKQLDYKVEFLPVDSEGHVLISELERVMAHDVLLVSIMAVNNEIGTIQDVGHISRVVRAYGAVFHCDGAQAPAAIEMNGIAEDVDLLSLSAHKVYGPKGIGALFVRRELHSQIEPLVYGGGQQNNLRSGTLPVPLCVGMGAALALLEGDNSRREREEFRCKRDSFVQGLKALNWPVSLNGPQDNSCHPANASICFHGWSANDVLAIIQPHLAASTGSACTSGLPEPSHVLRAIGLSDEDAESTIRFSLGRDTSDAELRMAIEIVDQAIKRLANDSFNTGEGRNPIKRPRLAR